MIMVVTKRLSLATLCIVSSVVDHFNVIELPRILFVNGDGQSSYRDPSIATPEDLWMIEPQPELEYDNNYGFTFTYTVSNFIDQGQAGFYIYDQNCRSGSGSVQTLGFNTTASRIIQDVTPGSETNMSRIEMTKSVDFFVKIDPFTIPTNPDIFINFKPGESEIFYCVVFYLNSTGDDALLEISAQETEVKLIVNMTKMETDFDINDIEVTPKDETDTGTDLGYFTEAFLCNPNDGTEITSSQQSDSPFRPGQLVSICIKPDDTALQEGIRMESVKEFQYTRDTVVQEAIKDGIVSDGGLTDYTPTSCAVKEWCSISTILFASFFQTAGSVSADGVASIQYQPVSNNDRRRTTKTSRDHYHRRRQTPTQISDDEGTNDRFLQVIDGNLDETIQSFDMVFNVVPMDDSNDETPYHLTLLSSVRDDDPIIAGPSTMLFAFGVLVVTTIELFL